MIKFIFSVMVSVTFARWSYNELKLVAPSTIPTIDFALEKIQIPTHDQWADSSLGQIILSSQGSSNGKANPIKSNFKTSSKCLDQPDPSSNLRAEQASTSLAGLVDAAERAFQRY